MKAKIYLVNILIVALCICNKTNAQSNRTLSNLTSPTAINQSLLPNSNNAKDLGSDSLAWRNIYLANQIFINKKRAITAVGTGNFFMGLNAGQGFLNRQY
jgi:hypothetical protein